MRWFLNSHYISGGIGIFLGFVVVNSLISYRENEQIILSLGEIGTSTSTAHNQEIGRLRGRILCLVISALEGEKAKTVKNTWGQRCSRLIFLTSREADGLDTIILPTNVKDKRETLWTKVTNGFFNAYSSYIDFDWFLKADDDTYVVMENLKLFLDGHNASKPLFFGCRLQEPLNSSGFMSGGAGYVLSREALRLFVEEAIEKRDCFEGALGEDVSMGRCMESVNARFVDTRDYFGRHRFIPVMPTFLGNLQPRLVVDDWYYRMMYYPTRDGLDCCAESAVTFHYVTSQFMNLIEFFLHSLSPHRRKSKSERPRYYNSH